MKILSKFLCAGFLAFVTFTTPAFATVEIFLKVDGIAGDAIDDFHPQTISLLSLSTNVFQQGLNLAGGGAGAGKTQFNPIQVVKRVDKTSPAIFVACAMGKHIKNATIFVRDGVSSFDFFKIVLTDVFVTSITSSTSAGDDGVTESVTLSFAKIEWDFTPSDQDGLPLTPITGGFDVKLNKSFTSVPSGPL